MSEENIIINNSKENQKTENDEKINLSNLNNYLKSQENTALPLNMNKDQLFQSFLLFQNFLSMNPNLIKGNKIPENLKIEEKDIKPNVNISKNSNLNESKVMTESKNNIDEENKIKSESKSTQNENNPTQNETDNKNKNININLYDEIPIKPSGYNFVELLEKTLANEENNKNENDKKYVNTNPRIRQFNKKNINNITNDTTSSNYNNMSEPNIPKENKYFKINKSYDKKEEEILSMSNEE